LAARERLINLHPNEESHPMSTTVKKQVLITARALIADPTHWTRSFLACNAAGRPVHWCDPSATAWCAMGAIYRSAYEFVGNKEEATRIGKEVAKGVAPIWICRSLMTMNDVLGHTAILAKFDKALAAA
jgi:hypothetical protein